ncbi:MAG: hypothetical protein FWC76_07660 [Defluviitaleaceae bacterium]|nr:hypothetical protein [Defluviitaleaceae bacterium]
MFKRNIMKIVLMIFAAFYIFLLVSWLGGGSQTYSFTPVDPPEEIINHWRQVDPASQVPIRSFRVDAEGSPFDGEIVTFFGYLIIYVGGDMHVYFMRGNRLFFNVEISTTHGRMAVDGMREFGFGRAAARYYDPVIWQDSQQNPVPPPGSITEEEARALRYLLTVAILNFGFMPSMPMVSIFGVALFAAGIAHIIITRRFKMRGEERPSTLRYRMLDFAFAFTITVHISMFVLWRLP